MDRSAINTALAKALAYKACGKHAEAEIWAINLLRLLDQVNILSPLARERIAREGI